MKKYSVIISGHRTSISMEPDFWDALHTVAAGQNKTLSALIAEIDNARTTGLSSAIRVYILNYLQKEKNQENA